MANLNTPAQWYFLEAKAAGRERLNIAHDMIFYKGAYNNYDRANQSAANTDRRFDTVVYVRYGNGEWVPVHPGEFIRQYIDRNVALEIKWPLVAGVTHVIATGNPETFEAQAAIQAAS